MNKMKKYLYFLLLCFTMSCVFSNKAEAAETSGFYQYEKNDTGVTITKYTGGEIQVSIPSRIAGKKVTVIGDHAFENNDWMEKVKIPSTVTTIGYGAFRDCDSLTEITIPNTVTVISGSKYGAETFGYCDNLKKVVIGNGLKEIPEYCFVECPKLKTVIIGKKVESIGTSALSGCALSSVALPSSMKTIGDHAFEENRSLAKLTMNKGLNEIGYGAFRDCDSLTEITIPNTVAVINSSKYGAETFGDCGELRKIIIPNSVKEIGECLLSGSNHAVIYGYAGSAAHTYADENDISFVPMSAVKSSSIKFKKKSVKLFPDQSCRAEYTILPANTTDAIAWSSSDDGIASVDNVGNIRARREGSVSIIATTTSGKRASLTVTVLRDPEEIAFAGKSATIEIGGTYTQKAKVDNGRKDVPVTYTSSNKKIATVDNNGKVKGIAAGTVKITAKTHNGLQTYYTVQVIKPAISLNKTSMTIIVGKTASLKATLNTGSAGTIKFKSSNKNVATVSSNGKVKAKTCGKATITAYTSDGKTAKCTVYAAPKKTAIVSATAKNKSAVIKWEKQNGVDGYEIYMSQKKSGEYKLAVTAKAAGTKYTKKALTSKKTYYFKVRAYKTINGKKIYGAFSDVKSAKIK